MKVLVIANNKGGIGKTTLSKIISEYFARIGKRVLGVDLDPQCNFSRRFVEMVSGDGNASLEPGLHPDYDPGDPENDDWDGRSSTADIYFEGAAAIYPTELENFSIIPAHGKRLNDVERVTNADAVSLVHDQLRQFLFYDEDGESLANDYDLVVIDTSPSKGPLTVSAVRAATHMLIPAEMDQFSIEGLYGMSAMWSRENMAREKDNELKLVGILANKYQKQRSDVDFVYSQLKALQNIGPYLLNEKMHYWQAYAEANMHNAGSIFDLKPSDKARKEAEEICRVLGEKLFND